MTPASPEPDPPILCRVDPESPDPMVVARAGHLLRAGQVIAHPSDTVFGLAAAARHEGGLARLRSLKGIEPGRPFIVLIDEPDRVDHLASSLNRAARDLMRKHWPGPLTVILEARPGAPGRGPDGSIALRCPAQLLSRELARKCQGVLASTSANISGRPTVESGTDALRLFGSGPTGLALVIDRLEEETPQAAVEPSTIVDCRGEHPLVVRAGSIPPENL